jgi:hypothetical protein
LDDDFVSEHSDTDGDNVEPNVHHPDNISDHDSSSFDNSSAAETDSSDHDDDDDPPGTPPPPPVPHAAVTPAPPASSDSDTVVTQSRNPGVNYTPSSQEYENDDEAGLNKKVMFPRKRIFTHYGMKTPPSPVTKLFTLTHPLLHLELQE